VRTKTAVVQKLHE